MKITFDTDTLTYTVDGKDGASKTVPEVLEKLAVLFTLAASIEAQKADAVNAGLDAVAQQSGAQ